MNKFDLRTYYFEQLNEVERFELRLKLKKASSKIDYPTFFQWLQRNNIPDNSKELFATEIIGKPVNEVFPELTEAA